MKNIIIILLLMTAGFGCKRRLSPSELQDELKRSMLNYLQHQDNFDSSRMKFEVLEVTYFEDIKAYDCEFKVRLKQNGHDTTGIMTGTVTKDFSIVRRKL